MPEAPPLQTHVKPADEATIAYIKRVLCKKPSKPGSLPKPADRDDDSKSLEELLPPLTSSNEMDVQLYAIIAVILNQFVQTWYGRITPDGDFVSEVVKIIAHCTRGIEDRLRRVDVKSLLLDELPGLVDAHLHSVQFARQFCHGPQMEGRLGIVFNTLRPHSALSPAPIDEETQRAEADNEVAWSQLVVDRIIPLVLPPEDLANPCLHVLVSEIFSQMIVYNAILGKTSEPWLLWEGVTKVIYALRPRSRAEDEGPTPSPINRLEQYGLLSSAELTGSRGPQREQRRVLDIVLFRFWSTLQQVIVIWALLRPFVLALMRASPTQQRPTKRVDRAADDPEARPPTPEPNERRPIAAMRIWTCLGRVVSLRDRMPWLSGLLSLLQWLSLYGPGQVCGTSSALDRLTSHHLHSTLLSAPAIAHWLPPILQTIRSAAFPDNALAPARPPPSTREEVIAIERECARAIVHALPEGVLRRVLFATADVEAMEADVREHVLALVGDGYVNKHLLVRVVELLVVRLFPELLSEDDEDAAAG